MTFFEWLNDGLVNFSAWQLVAYTLIMTHITIVTVTVYLHRHGAHRALELNPVLKHFFRFWTWFTTGMSSVEWISVHRKHHATCETEDDPHSPQVMGLKRIFWGGAEAYEEACTPETLSQYGRGTADDWLEHNVYGRFRILGVAIMLIIDVALFGVIGLTVWAVQMLWIPVTAAGVINGVGHYWGYRNFECPDAARNIVPWGIIIGGEELHNNHHTYPNSAKLSVKSWEFDIGWFWIRLFETLGLAKVRSTGPVATKVEGKSTLDTDTAWALVNDRFRVMARYAERVVSPLVQGAYKTADEAQRSLLRRADKVLCREESLVDEAGRERISQLVGDHPDLKVIYDLRVRLQALWANRGAGAETMLQDLGAWCRDAEATGIQALREFVDEIKSYTVPKAATA